MKKLISSALILALILSFTSCGAKPTDVPDTFTTPREPETFLEGCAEVSVSVGDISELNSALFELALFTQRGYAEAYNEYYHGGANGWVSSLALDMNGKIIDYVRTGSIQTSYNIDLADTSALISEFTGESTIGATLALLGEVTARRKISDDLLRAALAFSDDADDSLDPTGKVRTIAATFTCEEIADMLTSFKEDNKLTDEIKAFWESFFGGEPEDIAENIRESGDFDLSIRITSDAASNHVQFADILASGNEALFSIAYVGETGDIEISVQHTNSGNIIARYRSKYEDGRHEVQIRMSETRSVNYGEGRDVTEKEIKLIESDGAVYLSSIINAASPADDKNKDGKGVLINLSSSIKYDSKSNTYTLTGGVVQLKLKLDGDKLTGEIKNTTTGWDAELIFESEKTDTGRIHTLTKIKTSSRERDVSAAGVVFEYR